MFNFSPLSVLIRAIRGFPSPSQNLSISNPLSSLWYFISGTRSEDPSRPVTDRFRVTGSDILDAFGQAVHLMAGHTA